MIYIIYNEIAYKYVIRVRHGEFTSLSHVGRGPTRFLRAFLSSYGRSFLRNYVYSGTQSTNSTCINYVMQRFRPTADLLVYLLFLGWKPEERNFFFSSLIL